MNFDYSEKTKDLIARLEAFMDEHIYPNEKQYLADVEAASTNPETRWKTLPLIEDCLLYTSPSPRDRG